MFHAGHAVARALHHRIVFLSTVDGVRTGRADKIDIIRRQRRLHHIVDLN